MVRIFVLGGQQLKFRVPPGRISNYPHGLRQSGRGFPRFVNRRGKHRARRKLWNYCEQIFVRKIKSDRRADQWKNIRVGRSRRGSSDCESSKVRASLMGVWIGKSSPKEEYAYADLRI